LTRMLVHLFSIAVKTMSSMTSSATISFVDAIFHGQLGVALSTFIVYCSCTLCSCTLLEARTDSLVRRYSSMVTLPSKSIAASSRTKKHTGSGVPVEHDFTLKGPSLSDQTQVTFVTEAEKQVLLFT
jgi:hypothetical protein